MATSARMYLLAVTKAGSFFPRGSDLRKEYAQLMLKNFQVDVLDKSFKPNAFVLERGTELYKRVQLSHEKFISYAKSYGVQPKYTDTGLY
ncbi:hypothetical protein IFR05_005297 [Cadophora sp. M221]|nr:hypothetical protein IFR05_005297 [Cadophora sp. M221]